PAAGLISHLKKKHERHVHSEHAFFIGLVLSAFFHHPVALAIIPTFHALTGISLIYVALLPLSACSASLAILDGGGHLVSAGTVAVSLSDCSGPSDQSIAETQQETSAYGAGKY